MIEGKVEDKLEQDLPGDQQDQDDMITIVLTADNHLGSTAFDQQPRKREERQQRLRHAFQQATDFAIGQGVDLFVQAGDLFDRTDPSERDRSFVAARLAQLRQAGIRTFALGGVHDTPAETHSLLVTDTPGTLHEDMSSSSNGDPLEDVHTPAPQVSYARLGALHYFTPNPVEFEPVVVKIRNMLVAICGLGVLAGQERDPLARIVGGQAGRGSQEAIYGHNDIERAAISLLVLHAPIEGLSPPDTHAQVSRASIENQSLFRYILAGYHHSYRQLRIGQCDVIVAGATQHIDFSDPSVVGGSAPLDSCGQGEQTRSYQEESKEPGFVFLGLGASGIRWCKHIVVDALLLQRLVIHISELWSNDSAGSFATGVIDPDPTGTILERLRPLCSKDAMVQLRLEGQLTRNQYHQLDLNRIRHYGEEQCFDLTIDDSNLDILPALSERQATASEAEKAPRYVERFSPREELVALTNELIAATNDEQEKKALRTTKEELLAAMDEVGGVRFIVPYRTFDVAQ